MINLLPQHEMDVLIYARKKKLVMVLGVIAMVFLVSATLVLFSVKFYLLRELVWRQSLLTDAQNEYHVLDTASSKKTIQDYNLKTNTVSGFFRGRIPASDIVSAIALIPRPSGFYLTNMIINEDNDRHATKVTLAGVSNTRDDLIVFKKSISNLFDAESDKKVDHVYLPIENWVKAKNVSFSLTFEVSSHGTTP